MSRSPTPRSAALPALEDAIEIVCDQGDDDFGRARVRTAERDLPQHLPGFYCNDGGLDTDDYQWLVEDGFFSGRTLWQREELPVNPDVFPPIDLAPGSDDAAGALHSAPDQPAVFDKHHTKFEERRLFLHSSARLLRLANIRSSHMQARSRSPSPVSSRLSPENYFALGDGFYEVETPLKRAVTAPELGRSSPPRGRPPHILSYMKNGPQPAELGLDSVPVLTSRHKFDPIEVDKAYTRRTYGDNSIMNVRHDSEFLITPSKAIPVEHISTCLYRNDRKYGALFDQKALKRKSKRNQSVYLSRAHTSYGPKLAQPLRRIADTLQDILRTTEVTPSLPPLPLPTSPQTTTASFSLPVNEVDQAALTEASHRPLSARTAHQPSVFEKEPPALDIGSIRASFATAKQSMRQAMQDAVHAVEMSSPSSSPPPPASPLPRAAKKKDERHVYPAPASSSPPSLVPSQSSPTSLTKALEAVQRKPAGPSMLAAMTAPVDESRPVGFTYTATNQLAQVHLASQQPKPRPRSASKLDLSVHERYHLSQHISPDIVQQSLTDMLKLRQRRARADCHPRKDLAHLSPLITPEEAEAEREVLMEFYQMCQGEGWTRSEHWGSALSVKHWYGVATTVEGYVFEINLSENNLKGKFPDMLHRLSRLETIVLDRNALTGPVPDYMLQKCFSLQVLSAQYNQLSGPLAINNFCELSALREVWLTGNKLVGRIQEGVIKLTALTHLSLAKNAFEGSIPAGIGKLHNLVYLSLAENCLTGQLPPSMIALHQLQTLSLHNNRLTGKVPDWLFALTCLEDVYIFNNAFENSHEVERVEREKR